MRTSRDLARPLVALLLIAAAVPVVSTVAAFRSETTAPQHSADTVTCSHPATVDDDGGRAAEAERCSTPGPTPTADRTNRDHDGDDDGGTTTTARRTTTRTTTTTVTTESGAS